MKEQEKLSAEMKFQKVFDDTIPYQTITAKGLLEVLKAHEELILTKIFLDPPYSRWANKDQNIFRSALFPLG